MGAAPESSAFPMVSLAALILTARTVLWQTSAGTSCLLRGESAGQRQQEADCQIYACSLPYPTVSLLFFLQRSLCEDDSFPIPFKRICWKELALSEVAFIKDHHSTAVSLKILLCFLPSNQWICSYGFRRPIGVGFTVGCVYVFSVGLCRFCLTDMYVPLDFSEMMRWFFFFFFTWRRP